MHISSMTRMKYFIDNYVEDGKGKKVLDVGSYDVNGCYKELFSEMEIEYVGLDITAGPNVDIAVIDAYHWDSIPEESFDYIISGQAFEHIEYPWLTMEEIYKKLKKDGIICIIAPNGLLEHRCPTDCYRYYSDGMRALAKWGGFETIEVSVAGIPDREASMTWDETWNDVCLVACKSRSAIEKYSNQVMFPIERRLDLLQNMQLQYEFAAQWLFNKEIMDELIIQFIRRGKYEKVYIVGNENMGIVLADLFEKKEINYQIIRSGITPILEELITEMEICLKENNDLDDTENHILCVLTILDAHRRLLEEIKKKYAHLKVAYIDRLTKEEKELEFIERMKAQFVDCSQIYIYGNGANGQCIFGILKKYSISVTGFVVSDDHYKESGDCVYKISEISNDSGIIISPSDDREIKRVLKKLNFRKYIDGKKIWEYKHTDCDGSGK